MARWKRLARSQRECLGLTRAVWIYGRDAGVSLWRKNRRFRSNGLKRISLGGHHPRVSLWLCSGLTESLRRLKSGWTDLRPPIIRLALMRFVIATYGTMGDVQPLLGLAAELSRRGHAVKFAAPPDYRARVSSLGFEFVSLGPPMNLDVLREVYGRASSTGDALGLIRSTLPLVIKDTPQMVQELSASCQDADLLISVPYQLAGRIVHELLDIPLVHVFLSPFGGLSRSFAAATASPINQVRRKYSLKSIDDPLGPNGSSSLLGLHAVSPQLILRSRWWPEKHHIIGFFFFNEIWSPEPDLEAFVANGEPPIAICFGSMLHIAPEQVTDILRDAIRLSGKRFVVQRGWSGLDFGAHDHNALHVTGFVSHPWLFRRVQCVIHAGGAGTTAETLRAGVPSVVVPHLLDQFLWANLLKEHGCAADVIPYPQLSAARLAEAVDGAVSPRSVKAAAGFSQNLCQEEGTSRAAEMIELEMQQVHSSA
jgi:sterol 3beta-glucosyltransferase